MARQAVTISDIAEKLDVSKATVSYVLNGKAESAGVSKQMSRRVLETAEQLGYVPNHWARTLRGRRTGMISVLFDTLLMGWSQRVMEGVESVLLEKEYSAAIYAHTATASRDERFLKSEEHKILSILERRDEGVICQIIPQMRQQYRKLQQAGVAIVILNEIENMHGLESVDRVTWDSGPAAEVAVGHLIERGYRRIGYYGLDMEISSCQRRYAAYMKVMEQAGLEVDESWVINPRQESMFEVHPDFEARFRELMLGSGPRPDAFYVMNDSLAIQLMGMIREIGLKVPDDLALIGMGELDVTSVAGLTTVREPLVEMGAESARMVLERIENPKRKPVHKKIKCNELIVRDSI